MKEKIHPKVFENAKVVCACGNTFTAGSTRQVLKVEVCSKCHPFFTGEKRMMDTAGRVERFRRRYSQPPRGAGTKTAEPVEAGTKAPEMKVATPKAVKVKTGKKVTEFAQLDSSGLKTEAEAAEIKPAEVKPSEPVAVEPKVEKKPRARRQAAEPKTAEAKVSKPKVKKSSAEPKSEEGAGEEKAV